MSNGAYYNDNELFSCRVIEANIRRGRIPAGRVHHADIRDVTYDDIKPFSQFHFFAGIGIGALACRLAGIPDDFSIGTGGFPCQDISCAGSGEGIFAARSGLFWNMLELFELAKPRWLLLENVPNLRTKGIELVLAGLEIAGYCPVSVCVVGADDIGAPHKRKRVWIVARRADESLANPSCWEWGIEQQFKIGSREWPRYQPSRRGRQLDNTGLQRREQLHRAQQAGRDSAFGSSFLDDTDLPFAGRTGFEAGNDADGQISGRPQTPSRSKQSGGTGRGGQLADSSNFGSINVRGSSRVLRSPEKRQHRTRKPSECSSLLADSDSGRCRQSPEIPAGQSISAQYGGQWPARPGEQQFDWEEPRTFEPAVGESAYGASFGLVRNRRKMLKALGNAWVVQCAVPFLKWIYQTDLAMKAAQ